MNDDEVKRPEEPEATEEAMLIVPCTVENMNEPGQWVWPVVPVEKEDK